MIKHHFLPDPKSRALQLRHGYRLCHHTATSDMADEIVHLRLRDVVGRRVMSLAGAGVAELDYVCHGPWQVWRFRGPFGTRTITSVPGSCCCWAALFVKVLVGS